MQVTDEMVKALRRELKTFKPDDQLRSALTAALTAALSDKQAGEVKIKPLEVEEVGDPEAWLFHDPPERRIMVRPLRWKGPDSSGEYHSLDGLWGYILRAKNGNGFWLTEVGGYFPTVEAARAAAQSDYEQRIRSALVDVPAVEVKAKRWLVEETLPSGSIKWEVVEHESHARKIAAMYRNATVTPLYTSPPLSQEGEDTAAITIDIQTAEIINGAFLPSNPRRMRNAHTDVIKAAEVFKRAIAATRSGSATTASGDQP